MARQIWKHGGVVGGGRLLYAEVFTGWHTPGDDAGSGRQRTRNRRLRFAPRQPDSLDVRGRSDAVSHLESRRTIPRVRDVLARRIWSWGGGLERLRHVATRWPECRADDPDLVFARRPNARVSHRQYDVRIRYLDGALRRRRSRSCPDWQGRSL